MSFYPVTVVGGGACAYGLAVDLIQRGHQVRMLEHPEFVVNVQPLISGGPIEYHGFLGNGTITPQRVSIDADDVVPGSRWVFVTVPAYGHENFAKVLAPALEDGQVLVVNPGPALGSFAFKHLLNRYGCDADVTIVETHTVHTSGSLVGPGSVQIGTVPGRVLFSAFPAIDTDKVAEEFVDLIPRSKPAAHVLELAMESWNIIAHTAPMVLNAGRVEYAKGEYRHYAEGITKSVGRVMDVQDEERLAVASALDLNLAPHKEIVARYLPYGDEPSGEVPSGLYEAYQTPKVAGSVGPGSLSHRYLTEDIPYGLVSWVSIGRHIGIPMPINEAIVTLAGSLMGENYFATGRTLDNLGLGHVESPEELLRIAVDG